MPRAYLRGGWGDQIFFEPAPFKNRAEKIRFLGSAELGEDGYHHITGDPKKYILIQKIDPYPKILKKRP